MRGFRIQQGIACCATCTFGGYLGDKNDKSRMCICEVQGECKDGDYAAIAVEPLAICDAYKPSV